MDWVAAGGVCLGFNLSFAHAPPSPMCLQSFLWHTPWCSIPRSACGFASEISLLLLGCALSRYLWGISIIVASIVIGVTSFLVVAGAASDSCPYQTSGSLILRYLWPRIPNILYSAIPAVGSVLSIVLLALGGTFMGSQVMLTIVLSSRNYYPWWRQSNVMPFLLGLILKIPLALVADVYDLLRVVVQRLAYILNRASYLWFVIVQPVYRSC